MNRREQYTCPLEITHDMIKGKWKPILLWQIGRNDVYSFAELKKSISGISEKMLTQHLNELHDDKLISKKKTKTYPLSVEYKLTARGEKILQAIIIMQEIGSEILSEN